MKHLDWKRGDILVCMVEQENLVLYSKYEIMGLNFSPGYDFVYSHQVYLPGEDGYLHYYRILGRDYSYNFITLKEFRKLKLEKLNEKDISKEKSK